MSPFYWLLYESPDLTPEGPYNDIHRCRDHAVADSDNLGCRVQIHQGEFENCEWDGPTRVEEW